MATDLEHRGGASGGRTRTETASGPAPGRRSLTAGLQRMAAGTAPPATATGYLTEPAMRAPAPDAAQVQRALDDALRPDLAPGVVERAAERGTSGGASALPHRDAIQRSFGPHEVSGIEAHVGGPAAAAASTIGAAAFATGHHVAFAAPPDLFTAAHEAAHVVQQRGGVQLLGGLDGGKNDPHEQHADQVAARVVRGESAVDLLDHYGPAARVDAGGGVQRHAVQRVDYDDTTVGVEQEITGHKVKISNPKDRGVLGEVQKDGVTVAEFTSDMGSDGIYTIELRTKPCATSDATGVANRKAAIATMVKLISAAAGRGEAIQTQDKDGFHIEITMPRHTIEDGHGTGFANQASMGVQTEAMVGGSEDGKLVLGNAAWYSADRASQLPTAGLTKAADASKVYAMLAGVVDFLAGILRKAGNSVDADGNITLNIFDPAIKDSWAVLPRTPPWEWLDLLDANDKGKVRNQVIADASVDKYGKAALVHIQNKGDLAGHKVPAATIKNKHSSVFEFRSVPKELTKYLHSDVEVPKGPVGTEDMRAAMAARQAQMASQHGKDEEDDEESSGEDEFD